MRWRLWLFKAVTAGVGILASLLTCELVLRVQEPFTHFLGRTYPRNIYVPNETWDHWALPNLVVPMLPLHPPEYPRAYDYVTNRFGCRHAERLVVPKPKGVRRILILGDSFTEGYYDEDTIAARLEARLNQTPGAPRVEAVNCGCWSYSPLPEYLRLKNQLVQMEPDEIILNIDQTDVFDDYWRYRPSLRVGPDGDPLGVGERLTGKRHLMEWLKARSFLARFFSGLRWTLLVRFGPRGPQVTGENPRPPTAANIFAYYSTLPVDSPAWQREVGYCLENILRIIRYTQQRRIPLTITMYPHRQQLQADPGEKLWNQEFEHRVELLCRQNGIDFFSAFDGIARAYRVNPDIYWKVEMHFTPAGQRVWADLVTDYYLSREGKRALSGDAGPARTR